MRMNRETSQATGLLLSLAAGWGLLGCAGGGENVRDHADSPTDGVVVAYIDGEPLTTRDLLPPLAEQVGGATLAELVLSRAVEKRLLERNLALTPDDIRAEREMLLGSLSENPDEAVELLDRLRERRGLGPVRFADLLSRNAGLRKLAGEPQAVSSDAVRKAFVVRYGPQFDARLLMVSDLRTAQSLLDQLKAGSDFASLAEEHSTDVSATRGGRLAPVSAEDDSVSAAIRQTLGQLKPGEVSDPLAVDNGFALLKLEGIIAAEDVAFDDVKAKLEEALVRRASALRMRRVARELVAGADVVVLQPSLERAWREQSADVQADQPLGPAGR